MDICYGSFFISNVRFYYFYKTSNLIFIHRGYCNFVNGKSDHFHTGNIRHSLTKTLTLLEVEIYKICFSKLVFQRSRLFMLNVIALSSLDLFFLISIKLLVVNPRLIYIKGDFPSKLCVFGWAEKLIS